MDNENRSVSLADLLKTNSREEENKFWRNLPWQENELGALELGDLPPRLSPTHLATALQWFWNACAEGATVHTRFPHPRHDIFLRDLGYVRGLMPQTFLELDPALSVTGLAKQLGVRFEVVATSLSLDQHWQAAIDEGKLQYEDIELIARQANNVIEWIDIKMLVRKSLWIESEAPPAMDASMRKQLMDQLASHEARGDTAAAKVIREFLEKSDAMEKAKK